MIKPWHALLGIEPDKVIAERFGLKKINVTQSRIRRGIPVAAATPHGGFWLWDDPANVALLGTIPDRHLARQLGIRQSSVQVARTRRGIAPACKPNRSAKANE